MDATITAERLLAQLHRAKAAPELYSRLGSSAGIGELFARASALARSECGFSRAVVLSIRGTRLDAGQSQMLEDEESDRLRREILRYPVTLAPGCYESELLRLASSARCVRSSGPSALEQALALDDWAVGVIAPEGRPLALLLVDRRGEPVDELDRAAVEAFAAMIAVALEAVVLRSRVADYATELRHVSTFMHAMTTEMLTAPVGLTERGHVTDFPLRDAGESPSDPPGRPHGFTEREAAIASLLTEGRSNREIAAQLFVSPETVKMHVGRILRKLNASNRVEAAARLSVTPTRGDHATRSGNSPVTTTEVYLSS